MPIKFDAAEFAASLSDGLALAPLLDGLPEVLVYVKDRESRFVHFNQTLLNLYGFSSNDEIRGLTDADLHPRHMAEQYVEEDRRVMESGEPLPDQVWLVPRVTDETDGWTSVGWYESSKFPLRDRNGDVCGIAGFMRPLGTGELPRPDDRMESVLADVARNPGAGHTVAQMADAARLSLSQFERTFRRHYQMAPREYLLRVRINASCDALRRTDASIAEIAQKTGFYDQSHFTKAFRKFVGRTPTAFRREARGRPT